MTIVRPFANMRDFMYHNRAMKTKKPATLPTCLAAALCLVAYQAVQAAPQDAIPRQRVADVIVNASAATQAGEAREYVLSAVRARKNGYVSQRDLAIDERKLLDSELFSNVAVSVENTDEGLVVTYSVEVAPRLRLPIAVEGNMKFSKSKVRSALGLKEGKRVDRARLDAACDRLRAEYLKSYYNNVKIDAETSEPDAEGLVSLTVRIDEGQREKLLNFEFEGNTAIPSSELRSVLGRPSPYNPFKVFYSKWRLDAFDRESVRDRVAAAYREKGFLDVEVSQPRIERADEGARPVMAISIVEGRRYSIDSAEIEGVSLFPETDIRRAVSGAISRGAPASGKAIEDAEKSVRDYYGSRGYVETEVRTAVLPHFERAEEGKPVPSTLKVEVREGFLAHVRSVRIRGNTYTKDKVVRREILIAPGMLMNEVLAETSRRRAENLGFFEQVRMREVPSPDDPTLRDVIYDVTEKSTGTLMAGVGTSNIDNFLGYIDISQNNFDIANWPTFRGAGQKMRFSLSAGSSSNSGEISWTDPWFLDRQQSLNVTLYRREYSFSEYDETRIGGDVSLGVPLKYGRLTTRLGVESVSDDDFIKGLYHPEDDPDADFHYYDIDDGYMRVPLRVSWSYDTRNHPFVPTRGSRNNIFFEITNSSLGSEYDTYKVGADLRQYQPLPWWNHYLSMRLRAESIDAYGDTDEVPLNDRYFLGGARSLRGFKYRDIGPKAIPDEATGGRAHPLGGNTLAALSVEYNIPVVKVLRLAAFYDVGNVWADSFDADFGELASSWGVGIRFDIPGFPIRLDYATPVKHDDDYSRTERFIFSIGFE